MLKKTLTLIFITLTIAIVIFAIGCEFEEPVRNNVTEPNQFLSVALFKMEYDEKVSTFSLQWPGGIIHESGMAKTMDGDLLYLLDYQAVHQTIGFDEDGYLHWSKENFEGDESIRMPIEIWQQTESIRPAQAPNNNAVNRVVFSNGLFQLFSTDEDIVYSGGYNTEDYKIDPALLDSLYNSYCDTCSASIRNKILRDLETDGLNYQLTGDNFVVVEKLIDNDANFSGLKYLIDLRTGRVNNTALYRQDGRFDSVTLSTYETVNRFPIESHSVTYSFGEVNGNWQAKTVTYRDKSNINVIWQQI